MVEGVLGTRGEPHLIDQLGTEQLVENRIDLKGGEQLGPEAGSDHRGGIQCPPCRGGQPVDARRDGRLHRRRHSQFGKIRPADIPAAFTRERPALFELTDHLLHEERVTSGPLGDDRRELADRGIRSQQLAQ